MSTAADRQVASFLADLGRQRLLSPATIKALASDLAQLLRFAAGYSWSALKPAHIRSFVARIHQLGRAPLSLRRLLSSWRRFFAYLAEQGIVTSNPVLGLRAPRAPLSLPRALSPDEIKALLDTPRQGDLALRDAAMFETAYSSGLRVSELTGLDCEDLDPAAGLVKVRHGKGDKERIIPIGSMALQALEKWLALRAAWGLAARGPLFVSRSGRRISPRSAQLRLHRLAQAAGIGHRVTPHMLRHSCASHLLQSSGDLRGVQEILGHADVSSTQIYTHLDFQALAKVYDRTHPRARRKT